MSRIKFNIKTNTDTVLKNIEKRIKYIHEEEKNTYIDYSVVEGVVLPIIKYNIFSKYDSLIHGFSTRLGGVSKEHLASMNLSFSRGDLRENVIENHRRFGIACGYDHERLVFSDQIHTTKIKKVTEADIGKGIVRDSDILGVDGLVTNEKNIPLITFYADCVPLYFYDPQKEVVALAHSGWKGTVNKIGTSMIKTMTEEYGCNPKEIICGIGPSICMDCYEVSSDVADVFKQVYSKEQWESMSKNIGNDKYFLDLHRACKFNLLDGGVLEEHIAMPDMCTCCNRDILFSHRGSNGLRGNLAAVIMLK